MSDDDREIDPEAPHGRDGTTGLSLGGIDAGDEWAVKGGKVPALAVEPTAEARFGGRVLEALRYGCELMTLDAERGLREVAAAIDHDAEQLRGEVAGLRRTLELVRQDLRRQVEEAVPLLGGPRCGERLRRWLDDLDAAEMRDLPSWAHNDLRAMVASLDLDAAWLRERTFLEGLRHAREHLRPGIEEAVERLKYSVIATVANHEDDETVEKDVLDAEPFLEALGAIFGPTPGRAQHPPLTVLPQLIGSDLWPVIMARSEGRPRFLTPDEATAVVRELSGPPVDEGSES